ncbi:HlyD family type I secretion periplasmic adaptor subunit [Pseudoduganella sp. FT25W]|uniref:Membrane fusion protein (MFP) family protein n=1 Tax=Duganella alba TaxID=2666081 RepID=A0A6L5QNZ8_9BURK|nr:HlyD family type I secretion periplasmic adaptor subunit [Duganella alba]MRX11573.1 HlyD family type I secretion periplasmic adaptor subunit [Duganella alba]MRX20030.1 HlyD family type I secretion periplasmic adaptor subunit [Duganella alba]
MNIISNKKEPAVEVVTHDIEPLTVNTDARSYARMGWILVLVGFVGFLVWATFAPLDKGVPLSGIVVKESNRKAVQYLSNGIVQDILVADGDHVKAGQVLVRMNNVQVESALDVTLAQYLSGRATEARLQAELAGKSNITFPAKLAQYKSDPRVATLIASQEQLMAARQSALRSEFAGLEENVAGVAVQIKGLEESRDSKKEQLALLKEQVDNTRGLAEEGFIARNRYLELQRSYAQTSGAISEDIGNIGRARRQIAELNLKKVQRTQEYQKDVRTQLADTQKEADALEGRLKGQSFDVGSVDVRSPADGIVMGSNIFTRGGVVGAGAKMMEIVPTDDGLVVEGQLAVNLIDKVHTGLPVELIFSAFNTNKTPHIQGTVIQIAADRSVEERTGAPYYKVRAKVTPEGLKMITAKKMDVVPGMPVEMFIKTGERSMMSYLMKPVFDRAKTSMSEE